MRLFRKKMEVEGVVIGYVNAIPQIIKTFRTEDAMARTQIEMDDTQLAAVIAAMTLFFLSERFPGLHERNNAIMHRAFQATWQALPSVGSDAEDARSWFQLFNDQLLGPEKDDRVHMAASAVSGALGWPAPVAGESPVWFLAFLVHSSVQAIGQYRIV